ncbi:MAG: S8/S53 family peptidase [Bacteroidetes bacterium]|nr:MAG: S8/S53 family peptidase [Bacteroidota bacterium]
MKAILKYPLFRRTAPTNEVKANDFLPEGSVIDVEEIINGTAIDGISIWHRAKDGFFYWGGGVIEMQEMSAIIERKSSWITSLGLEHIWDRVGEKGARAKIAILDSGYNIDNSDLSEAVKDSKVFFASVAGKIITVHDTFGHGSHCASLIGGRNKNFITGCAPESELYIAKICSQGSVRSYSIMVDAIKWAIEKEVDVISISYGGETSDDDLENIIDKAVNEHNIIVIASIGDFIRDTANMPCFPALFKNCIAVGATNEAGKISSVTISNSKTLINAPGEDIPGFSLGMAPEPMTGTSQSSAIVAGIAGLIISRHKQLQKQYTVASIINLIIQNADDIQDVPGQKLISPKKIFSKI